MNVKAEDYCTVLETLYNHCTLRLQKFIQHEIKSSTRENYAIERHDKHEIYEAVAGVTLHIAYCFRANFFFISRKSAL